MKLSAVLKFLAYGISGTILVALAIVSTANAGGIYLNEYVISNSGTAQAGAQAQADDATTAATNPAGMTRLKGNALTLGAALLAGSTKFEANSDTTVIGGNGGEQSGSVPVLNSSYVHRLNDDWSFGVSLYSLTGAVLDPENDWAGRYSLLSIKFLTVSANPTLAYRVNDYVSIGAGPVVTYGKLSYSLNAPAPAGGGLVEIDDADDVALAANIGVLVELNPQTRFGLTYISETKLELEGDVKLSPVDLAAGLNLDLPLAQTVRFGAYHDINDKLAVMASVAWEDWSTLANQAVSTAGGSAVLRRNWEDTYHFSLGLKYRLTDEWLLQTGASYDTSPVNSVNRTADLPIDRQVHLALGAEYAWNKTMTFGGSFVYADLGDARISSSTLSGEYDTNRFVFFGVYSKWKW